MNKVGVVRGQKRFRQRDIALAQFIVRGPDLAPSKLMHPTTRFAIATYHALPTLHADDAALLVALRGQDLNPQIFVWNDPKIDWRDVDVVLIRSIWDYFERYAEFLSWLDQLQSLGVRTINPIEVLRWNSDKRYLRDLADADVAIVPTEWVAGAQLMATMAAQQPGDWVVKPTVSGGAWHAVRGRSGTPEFADALANLPVDMQFMVQPYLPEVATAGEWSLLFFGGQYSHAVLKTPVAGDYRVQEQYGGQTRTQTPPAFVLAAAQKVLSAARHCVDESPISYARVDGVVVGDAFWLMELELIEPSLFLADHPEASARCADVVSAAVRGD